MLLWGSPWFRVVGSSEFCDISCEDAGKELPANNYVPRGTPRAFARRYQVKGTGGTSRWVLVCDDKMTGRAVAAVAVSENRVKE